jgi:dihydrofolate reductase
MSGPQSEKRDSLSNDWTLVVAVANNGVIGRGDQLPWRMSSDLKRFKSLTMGHCLLMGRKTFESIGKPLPGRQTIVLTRQNFQSAWPQVMTVQNLAQVRALVEPGRKVMVVGGAQLYALALPHCSRIWITRVLAEVPGDVLLPLIDWSQWRRESSELTAAGDQDEWASEFERWQRI